jgi:hypothetical protein
MVLSLSNIIFAKQSYHFDLFFRYNSLEVYVKEEIKIYSIVIDFNFVL